eukprot:CAMPEP_0117587268 /NCGR_PEP_ID=MMETSP0784-20121206/69200_1 /TAXON_ID=39447 /ORGANISM="" /LENGTH=39 /DNA_ID= /DNA_START= /DNA_END= /DNA_ORIENTATION=
MTCSTRPKMFGSWVADNTVDAVLTMACGSPGALPLGTLP